jgi:hypothetical protein
MELCVEPSGREVSPLGAEKGHFPLGSTVLPRHLRSVDAAVPHHRALRRPTARRGRPSLLGPEQLEDELEHDDWIIESAALDDIFTEDPDGLSSSVLRRKGGRYELVARMPLDPSLN